jgi:hypothetical protein
MHSLRSGQVISVVLLATLVAGLSTVGCGSHGNAGTGGKGGGGAGAGGATAGSAGSDAGAGATGTGGDVDAAADAPLEMPVADAAPDGDATDVSSDAGVANAGDASDAAFEAAPPFDVGNGCDPPPLTEAPLVPATEGVPAAGLVLWLRGDRGVYKTPDANAVCAWADQSGHDFLLSNAGTRPTWVSGAVGAKDAVHFLSTPPLATGGVVGIAPTSGRTFVAVVSLVSTTARFEAVFQGQAASPGTYLGFDANTFLTAGSREGVYMTNNGYDSSLATSTSPRVHVYTIKTMTPGLPVLSNVEYRVNGVVQTLTRTGGGLGNGNLEDFSAANVTVVGGPASGDGIVAEVLVYDHALTDTDKTAVEAALKTRYGIP